MFIQLIIFHRREQRLFVTNIFIEEIVDLLILQIDLNYIDKI